MTEAVRVCVDATAVPVRPGGAGRYVVDLVAALARRTDVGLTVVCRRGDRARWTKDSLKGDEGSIPVIDSAPGPRPLRLAWEQTGLPLALRRADVDVLHSPHYTMPIVAPTPVVVTVHDLSFFDHPEWHEPAKVAFFRAAMRVAVARAATIVAVSECTADRLTSRLKPRCPVVVIPHGVDHTRFRPPPLATSPARTSPAQASPAQPPYIAFLGTIEPRKDVPTLVRAFGHIAARHPDLTLVVAGSPGWGLDAVEAAISANPYRERIKRPGYLSEEQIVLLLQNAAAVAYPSLEEGFGLPALEALACGAPLVTTTGSAMEEVAGDAALLVAPGDDSALADALDEVLEGGPAVEARRDRGFAVAARHTWEASAEAHVAVYRQAATERTGAR